MNVIVEAVKLRTIAFLERLLRRFIVLQYIVLTI